MSQLFRIEVQIPAQPEHCWTNTLTRDQILHLVDAQGTPLALDPYLRFWCSRYHEAGDRFECDYAPNPDEPSPYTHFMGTAL